MDVRFNDTRAANASAAKLWEVVTDYASYPTFNSDHQRTSCRPT
jgi:ribosome-associated toxin RatA of RatAB toxin-antitoxin module